MAEPAQTGAGWHPGHDRSHGRLLPPEDRDRIAEVRPELAELVAFRG